MNKKELLEINYTPDFFEDEKTHFQYAAITKNNVALIEAILKLDSNYKNDTDINAKPHKKYNGSTSYWFNQMKNGDDYAECIKKAVISIDIMDSTHLEATQKGREEMANIILKECPNLDALIKKLTSIEPFAKNSLVMLMSKELPAKGKSGVRSNFSFATKFCSCACIFLGLEDNYPRYDNVVSKVLPVYVKHYNKKECGKSYFQVDIAKRKEDFTYLSIIYEQYYNELKLLRNEVDGLSFNELDHVIWYCNKGN